jgi:hypothetical protein
MTWKRTSNLVPNQMRRHGLSQALAAGQVCLEAERLYPGMFTAVSLVRGVLKIAVTAQQQAAFRRIEGDLLPALTSFATRSGLPIPTQIRLTVLPPSAIV